MTYTPAIIKSAYRESNLIAMGTEPSEPQTAEALERLQTLIAGVYGSLVGEKLLDWPIGVQNVAYTTSWSETDWVYLLQNTRVIMNHNAAQTLYLPPEPDDGARVQVVDPSALLGTYALTLNGNGHTIELAASVLLGTASLNRTWMYRADKGDWVRLADLENAVDEEFPFPPEFDDYFITRLAMRINPRYGRSISEETAIELKTIEGRIRARYRQTRAVPCDSGVVMLTQGVDGLSPVGQVRRGRNSWMS